MKTQKQNEPQLSAEMEFHIREWKYWSDEILDQVQRFYESECGYNGECGHVWVDVEGDRLKLPAIENKFKYALVVAGTKRKALATALEEQRDKMVESVEAYIDAIYPLNRFIDSSTGVVTRGVQEPTHVRMMRVEDAQTFNALEHVLAILTKKEQ